MSQHSAITLEALDVHAVPLAGRNLIEASAGTGKTFNITGLYARLILGAADPDADSDTNAAGQPCFDASRGLLPEQILLVTFTKAATAELKDRIRTRLSQLAQTFAQGSPVLLDGKPEPFCATVWQQVQSDVRVDAEQLLNQLRLALATLDQAAISTIHSFCQRLLTEQAFEAGFDFDREMVSDESEVLAQITRDFWRSEVYPSPTFWADYLRSISIAPRTRGVNVETLSRIAASLAKLDVETLLALPEQPDLLALQTRWNTAVGAARRAWHEAEIASLLQAKWRDGIYKKTAKLDFTADTAWASEISDFLAQPGWSMPPELKLLTHSKLADAVLKKFQDQAPEHEFFAALEDLQDSRATLETDLAVYFNHWLLKFGAYAREQLVLRKAQAGQMSFDDSLTLLASALRDETRASNLIAKVHAKYRAALVDEFQDTDPTQFLIIDTLFGTPTADGDVLPFFMVGDPKQAIYAFRGADVYAYLGAREAAKGQYSIDTNYRSDAPIISFVNRLFAPETAFVEAQIQHPTIKANQCGASKCQIADDRAAVHAFVWQASKKDAAEKDCYRGVANEIAGLLKLAQQGQANLGARPLAPGDMAVLVSNHHQAAQVRRALAQVGVPSVSQSRDNVFASSEAQGLLALLKAVNEPANEPQLRRALVSGVMGYSVAQLIELQNDDAAWLAQIEMLQALRDEWRKAGFMAMFRSWLVGSQAPARLLSFDDGERSLTNLLHVAELIQNETRSRPSPALLLAWLERQVAEPNAQAEAQQMRLESDADRVKIVTIHASKGLEYPIVFCPFAWAGRKELLRDTRLVAFHDDDGHLHVDAGTMAKNEAIAAAEIEAYAEQMRLLYVALTRAKHRLYLAYPAFEKLHHTSKAGMKNAPLAQVLFRDDGIRLRDQVGEWDVGTLGKAFVHLGAADAPVSVGAWPEPGGKYRASNAQTDELQVAPWRNRALAAPWRLVSFSSLSRGQAKHAHAESAEDHDGASTALALTLPPVDLPTRFTFTRGADAGTALHGMFEHWDFAARERQGWNDIITRQLQRAGLLSLDSDDIPEQGIASNINQWLGEVIDTPLGDLGWRLADLPAKARLNEWPFLMHCPKLNLAAFCRVLAQPQFGVPAEFIAASERLKPEQLTAYLNGVIDLVCVHNDQYFIADYKSNFLGDEFAAYGHESMTEAMADAHYYLQYLLYVIAWQRHMRVRRGDDYNYERDFGGVLYLFIRGMHPAHGGAGVWFDKPCAPLIAALDAALGGQ
ncbi:exodeoxyribonuclease V subunit beta [Chitinibacter bivalviorum]|uniref:RecBCD enzyme subunit RecB n=1 Tax=Chitinibacter bivalviorum TaxID=2739434 RepID=A0A7H9BEL5_9NEIS|nr:exodeoxyribonuclease V subunit beta [Chitinibacter bivalviorum]QLG87173.1 exodeoxyribonuclease V subunit beta [Chitinibacter bivalviorum]